jgi:uncharacterized integral membrane protein (TIGR00698 family)
MNNRPFARAVSTTRRIAPGFAVAAIVAVASAGVAAVEKKAFGHPVIEALVVAILIGMAARLAWRIPDHFQPGVRFAAKQVLEVAVALLGAAVDVPLLLRAGPSLALGVVLLVVVGLVSSLAVGRAFGLSPKLAVLVACGNAICGNSAIAAVARVIDADSEHVASSIAFTAILGIVVVVGLPFLIGPLGLSDYQYGVLAGLTVYAVPQVLAAAFPVSAVAGQIGTLVKLVRVLMLGPVVLFFALRERTVRARRAASQSAQRGGERGAGTVGTTRRPTVPLVPWFIVGFLLLGILKSAGLVAANWVGPAREVSAWLTIVAMAALGLSADLRAVARVGKPVIAAVSASLVVLIVLGVTLIRGLAIR